MGTGGGRKSLAGLYPRNLGVSEFAELRSRFRTKRLQRTAYRDNLARRELFTRGVGGKVTVRNNERVAMLAEKLWEHGAVSPRLNSGVNKG